MPCHKYLKIKLLIKNEVVLSTIFSGTTVYYTIYSEAKILAIYKPAVYFDSEKWLRLQVINYAKLCFDTSQDMYQNIQDFYNSEFHIFE